jgi:4-amino-4-deoxy-L-arabinose transferase-like glycosyltransferase
MAKIISKSKIVLIIVLFIASFLRLYKLSVNPISLFGDELDLGYQAYSILKTGRDYYGNFMPIHFHSLAEWRTPLYLYSAVPTVAVWGISPLGVRVPAAVFGILGVLAIYLLTKEILRSDTLGLVASGVLAISPWHLQYSRAGFEVTQMLFFLLMGLWLFFRCLNGRSGKLLWLAVASLVITPWVYSTAKLFTPILLIILFAIYRREILSFKKKYLIYSIISGFVIGIPIAYSTIFGGGAQRFSYLSVFTDPVTESEVGEARLQDARMRGVLTPGTSPKFFDRVLHNKFTFWGGTVVRNLFQPFSTEFLFIKGDPNLRQSIGIGEFYKIDIIFLIAGLIFFLVGNIDKKLKIFTILWVLIGIIPAAITRDGGNHATRLILILPPLVLLVSYGLTQTYRLISGKYKLLFVFLYSLPLLVGFAGYEHNYWIHYPYNSERWWHAGFQESFAYIKSIESNYDRIFISMQGEPAWIFFAGWWEYPPAKWQQGFPFKSIWVDGFGTISYLDKYYFGSPSEGQSIYDLPKLINSRDIYLAVAKEVGWNLVLGPDRAPNGLKLLKAITYPSGEPAYYIFAKSQ